VRYSLLNFIECPHSKTGLTCVVFEERPSVIGLVREKNPLVVSIIQMVESGRVNQPGAMFGPTPKFQQRTWLGDFLQEHACPPAAERRNHEVVVEEGLLISAESGRWYPIKRSIPEILPDHLRDVEGDLEYLARFRDRLPEPLFARLHDPRIFTARNLEDCGRKYKRCEMTITSRIEDSGFFGPGYDAPFNPASMDHTTYLIRLFSFCLRLLSQNGPNRVVLDMGCGYAWTTEWLLRIGWEPIGVDITRAYLDIAAERLGSWMPHLIQADVENLPIRSAVLDAILGYEAFHHIPDRARAMRGFFRALRPGKQVVLAEPGAAHENAPGSVEVMEKYGILERGMDLADVASYAAGTGFLPPQRHQVIEIPDDELANGLNTKESLLKHSFTNSNLYTVRKPANS
jgi:SAM-dependent methyltransferase/uncharacterized protein YbaR (Trm112 family)